MLRRLPSLFLRLRVARLRAVDATGLAQAAAHAVAVRHFDENAIAGLSRHSTKAPLHRATIGSERACVALLDAHTQELRRWRFVHDGCRSGQAHELAVRTKAAAAGVDLLTPANGIANRPSDPQVRDLIVEAPGIEPGAPYAEAALVAAAEASGAAGGGPRRAASCLMRQAKKTQAAASTTFAAANQRTDHERSSAPT